MPIGSTFLFLPSTLSSELSNVRAPRPRPSRQLDCLKDAKGDEIRSLKRGQRVLSATLSRFEDNMAAQRRA